MMIIIHSLASIHVIAIRLQSFWRANGPLQASASYLPGSFLKEGSRFYRGGFYKHLKWRDDLVAEALDSALEMWKRAVNAVPEAF